jgi:hypothetical protein
MGACRWTLRVIPLMFGEDYDGGSIPCGHSNHHHDRDIARITIGQPAVFAERRSNSGNRGRCSSGASCRWSRSFCARSTLAAKEEWP